MSKELKRVYAIGMKASDLFSDLRDLCYADDLTEFDRLHDDLYYQQLGIAESLFEFEQEPDMGYEEEFMEALALARDIKKYHTHLTKLSTKNFNWIYG